MLLDRGWGAQAAWPRLGRGEREEEKAQLEEPCPAQGGPTEGGPGQAASHPGKRGKEAGDQELGAGHHRVSYLASSTLIAMGQQERRVRPTRYILTTPAGPRLYLRLPVG